MDWSGHWRSAMDLLLMLSQQTIAVPAWVILVQCFAPFLLFALLRYPQVFGLLLILGIGLAGLASEVFRMADPILLVLMTVATALSLQLIHRIQRRDRIRRNDNILHAIELIANRMDSFLDAIDQRTKLQLESGARADRDQEQTGSDLIRTRSASG